MRPVLRPLLQWLAALALAFAAFLLAPQPALANLPPVAREDVLSAPAGQQFVFSGADLVANDYDPDGDPLIAVRDVDTPPSHGHLFGNAGKFVYVPDAGFVGWDNFAYYAEDTYGARSNPANVVIWVGTQARQPTAVGDDVRIFEDGELGISKDRLLSNDSDPYGQALRFVLDTAAGHGELVDVGTHVVYRPAPDFFGTDTFTYRAVDDYGESAGYRHHQRRPRE
jgi:hypothetical protein